MIFIDTCIVIEYLKEKTFLSKYNLDELFISDIVVMELYQGAMNKLYRILFNDKNERAEWNFRTVNSKSEYGP